MNKINKGEKVEFIGMMSNGNPCIRQGVIEWIDGKEIDGQWVEGEKVSLMDCVEIVDFYGSLTKVKTKTVIAIDKTTLKKSLLGQLNDFSKNLVNLIDSYRKEENGE